MTTDRRYDQGPLPSWFEGYEQILPESLDDLKGPADGVLEVPTYIGLWDLAWEKKFPELWYRASVDVSIYDPRADEPFQLKEGWMKRSRRLT